MPKVEVFENNDAIVSFLSGYILETAKKAIKESKLFTLGVSGGSIVSMLATIFEKENDNIQWEKWAIFFCDERLVSFDKDDSTYGQFKQKVINKIGHSSSWFPIDPDRTPEASAGEYEKQMKVIFRNTDFPDFDILLLGMGPDGHTCSLFPGHKLLKENTKWVAAIEDSPKPPPCRITFTLPTVNNAKNIAFICTGANKSETLEKIFKKKDGGESLPAALVKPECGELTWVLDKPAASKLDV